MKTFAIRATVLSSLLAFLHGAAVAAEPTRHIVGVTQVTGGLQAVAAANLHAVEVIPQINAIVIEGSPRAAMALAKHKFVRYVELDRVLLQAPANAPCSLRMRRSARTRYSSNGILSDTYRCMSQPPSNVALNADNLFCLIAPE